MEKNADLQHKINDLQQEILNLQIDVDKLKMENNEVCKFGVFRNTA